MRRFTKHRIAKLSVSIAFSLHFSRIEVVKEAAIALGFSQLENLNLTDYPNIDVVAFIL